MMKGVLFHQDNAPVGLHKFVVQWLLCVTVALNWLITLHILLIWHHLTIFCSPTWKKNHLAGKQYRTDDQVISAVEDFFENQDESFYMYTKGIQALQHWWEKCVDRRGDYVEK